MDKAKIKGMIQEKLQMIETLKSHVQVLSELIDEKVSISSNVGLTSGSNSIAHQIESYRQHILQSIQSSLPSASVGVAQMGGVSNMGIPGGMPDMKKHFEEMKKEMEKKVKE